MDAGLLIPSPGSHPLFNRVPKSFFGARKGAARLHKRRVGEFDVHDQ
jgi:hypothetical protein